MTVTVDNMGSVWTGTLAELANGPGDGGGLPSILYITDLDGWYMLDPIDEASTEDNYFLITDNSGVRWRRMPDGLNKVVLFDDFKGDLIADEWALASGSDAQALDPVINAALNGTVRLTSGNVGGGDDAVDSSVLTHGLNWQCDQGRLVMQARVKMSAITNVAVFVGLPM